MIVMKFGGTSVGTLAALQQVCEIVQQAHNQTESRPGLVVVTSAMSGVTDALLEAAAAAVQGHLDTCHETYRQLQRKHEEVLERLVPTPTVREHLAAELMHTLRHLRRLLESVAVLGELTPRGRDWIAGTGETIMGPLLTQVLCGTGLPACYVDARTLIVTDCVFGGAEPLSEETEYRCRTQLVPLLNDHRVVVTNGYISATIEGVPTTLGRGGSDYSAAILGAALEADEIQIWTDVRGVKTADPRVVPEARTLREISFSEMAELAYYGAKVLHPKTVRPIIRKGLALRVLNTFEPCDPGTRVVHDDQLTLTGDIKAVTAIYNMNMIMIEGRGMIGVPGIAARTFQAVSDVQANVLMISQSSSEQSICFVVPNESASTVIEALQAEFHPELARGYIEKIEGNPDIVIIAAVGQAIQHTSDIVAKVFTALAQAQINVVSIAQGASDTMISVVVPRYVAHEGIRALHQALVPEMIEASGP